MPFFFLQVLRNAKFVEKEDCINVIIAYAAEKNKYEQNHRVFKNCISVHHGEPDIRDHCHYRHKNDSLLTAVLAEPVMRICNHQDDTLDMSVSFFRIIMGFMVFQAISTILNAALRGIGKTTIYTF